MDNEKVTWNGLEKFFATEIINQAKLSAKRWFIAWLITLAAPDRYKYRMAVCI